MSAMGLGARGISVSFFFSFAFFFGDGGFVWGR